MTVHAGTQTCNRTQYSEEEQQKKKEKERETPRQREMRPVDNRAARGERERERERTLVGSGLFFHLCDEKNADEKERVDESQSRSAKDSFCRCLIHRSLLSVHSFFTEKHIAFGENLPSLLKHACPRHVTHALLSHYLGLVVLSARALSSDGKNLRIINSEQRTREKTIMATDVLDERRFKTERSLYEPTHGRSTRGLARRSIGTSASTLMETSSMPTATTQRRVKYQTQTGAPVHPSTGNSIHNRHSSSTDFLSLLRSLALRPFKLSSMVSAATDGQATMNIADNNTHARPTVTLVKFRPMSDGVTDQSSYAQSTRVCIKQRQRGERILMCQRARACVYSNIVILARSDQILTDVIKDFNSHRIVGQCVGFIERRVQHSTFSMICRA